MTRAVLAIAMLAAPVAARAADAAEIFRALAEIRPLRLATQAPSIPEDAYAKALEGKTMAGVEFVEGEKAGKGWGVMVYDQPVEVVWKALSDDEAQAGRLPISVSSVIEGQPFHDGRYLFQYLPLPIVADRWWVVQLFHNGPLYTASQGTFWEQKWDEVRDPVEHVSSDFPELIQGGIPVEFTTGAWLLVRLDDGRTLAEYFAWSDPGGKIPAGPASRFAGGAIRDTMEAMGAMADDYARKTPRSNFVRPDGQPLP